MIAGNRSGPVLTLTVFAAGLAAAWFLYQGLAAPTGIQWPEAGSGKQPPAAGPRPAAQDFQLPPLSAFEEILNRPVFTPSRRPKAGAPVVISQDLSVKVIGTLVGETERRALLVPEGGGETLQLREGEEYQGWTLSEVAEYDVTFRRDDQEVRLEVDFKAQPTPVRMRPGQPRLAQPQGGGQGQADDRQKQIEQQRQRQQLLQQKRQERQQQLRQQRQQQQQQQQQQGSGLQ